MSPNWFGPSKKAIWQQLAAELPAEYIDGGWFGKDKIVTQYAEWMVILDTYSLSSNNSSTTYTRMRAPFLNQDDFTFRIYRRNLLTDIGKVFGLQDIEVGYRDFDRDFIIQGNHAGRVKHFFACDNLRALIQAQPSLDLRIRQDATGIFGPTFPPDVNEVHFQVTGVIKDLARLRKLFDLFAAVLDRLCEIGSAYPDAPNYTPH